MALVDEITDVEYKMHIALWVAFGLVAAVLGFFCICWIDGSCVGSDAKKNRVNRRNERLI